MTATPTFFWLIQGVPPKGWQHRTKFWKLKNHICQKVSPVLKSLNKNLLDGILKAGIIKLEVFLNLKSKNGVKFQKRFCTVPPEPALPLPFSKCHLNLHPHPLTIILHRATWTCTSIPLFKMSPEPAPAIPPPGNNSFFSLYTK